jgi:hypothetical protein
VPEGIERHTHGAHGVGHVKSNLCATPCRRATSHTTAPGISVFSTIRAFHEDGRKATVTVVYPPKCFRVLEMHRPRHGPS